MTRILAIADETTRSLGAAALKEMRPDVVVSCGDLPFDYLEYVASAANAPLLYVPGNHDPSLRPQRVAARPLRFEDDWEDRVRPPGGLDLDGRVVRERGITFAGLGGSVRYRPGPNQYTEREMRRRVGRLVARVKWRRLLGRGPVDVVVTHSPPRGVGDMDDAAHRGFDCFHLLVARLRPRFMLHGHIHPHGFDKPDRMVGEAKIVNVVPYRVLEVPS